MEARLPDPRGLCCTAAPIWYYVIAIDVLRSVAGTGRRTSNVIKFETVLSSLAITRRMYSIVGRALHCIASMACTIPMATISSK